MKIGTDIEHIQLECLSRNPEGSPCAGDVAVRATLRFQEFSGTYSEIWLEGSEIENFKKNLKCLRPKERTELALKA